MEHEEISHCIMFISLPDNEIHNREKPSSQLGSDSVRRTGKWFIVNQVRVGGGGDGGHSWYSMESVFMYR